MSDSTPAPKAASGILVPSWLVGIIVSVALATTGATVSTAYKVGVAAEQVANAAARVTALEVRFQTLADLQTRQAVADSALGELRRRVDTLEARAGH